MTVQCVLNRQQLLMFEHSGHCFCSSFWDEIHWWFVENVFQQLFADVM